MQILKPGKLPEKKLIKGTCSRCRAEVQWEQGEGKTQTHRNEDYWFIDCPTKDCGQQISGSPITNSN